MTQHWSRRNAIIAATVGLTLAAAAAVASGVREIIASPPGNPDPGDQRLHALAADPVFRALPPGAVQTSRQEKPAWHASSVFEGSGWHGPSVIVSFTSQLPAQAVFRFYAEQAPSAGWSPAQSSSAGLTWSWRKPLAGKPAYLSLFADFDPHTAGPAQDGTARSYSITAAA
jgi:hypothetical protein